MHFCIVGRATRPVDHVAQVVLALVLVQVPLREVVLGQLEDEREEREDLIGQCERAPREIFDFARVLSEERVEGLVGVLRDEFGDVD